MKLSMRAFVMCMVAALVALTGWDYSPVSAHTPKADKVTLTFWNGFTGPDRPAVEGLVQRFNATHRTVRIQMTITPWDSLLQKLPSALASGEGPDLMGFSFTYLPQYASSGYIKDLSSLYKSGSALNPSIFPKGLLKVLKYKGKYYGAPMNFATLLMYYNKDMFRNAGLNPNKPPKTWSQWISAIKKLTKHGNGRDQYGIAIGEHDTIPNWPIFMWGAGGDVILNGKPNLSNPKTLKALTTWGNLVKNNKVSPVGLSGAEADKLFQTQKAATEVTGPWMTNGFTAAGLHYGVAPVPAGPAGPVTLADSVVMTVNAKSKNTTAAMSFVKYWNAKNNQVFWSLHSGFPTFRLDLVHSSALSKNQWVPKFESVAPVARFYLPGQPKYLQINNDVVVPMLQQITYGRASVASAAKQADQQLARLLSK